MPTPPEPAPRRTERLVLRQWRADDRDAFAEMNADPAVMEHFAAPLSRAESDALADRITSAIAQQGWGLWALEPVDGPDAGRFAGFTGMSMPSFEAPFTPCVEVGWRLPRWAWGRGYASEAARHALALGFDDLGFDEIVSFTTVANARSRAVMERLGMTRDPADDFAHPLLPPGAPTSPHVLYRLARGDRPAGDSVSRGDQRS